MVDQIPQPAAKAPPTVEAPVRQPETQRKAAPKPQHMGVDPLRPLRYGAAFVKGTVVGLLDGTAKFGRKGFWAGIGLGLVCLIAAPTLVAGGGAVLMFGVGGLAVAGSLGGAFGALTGGFGDIGKSHRREKYAAELAERQEARASRPAQGERPQNTTTTYRDTHQARSNYNFERQRQQQAENDRDYGTYWQDKMDAQQSRNHDHGRGS